MAADNERHDSAEPPVARRLTGKPRRIVKLAGTLLSLLMLVQAGTAEGKQPPHPARSKTGSVSTAKTGTRPAASSSSANKTATPAAKPEKAHPLFLWKATSGDKGVVYLVGTLHMVRGSFYPLPAEIEKAFSQSQYLVLEIDLSRTDKAKLLRIITQSGAYAPGSGDSLKQHLSPATRDALTAYLGRSGAAATAFDDKKPWLVGLLISQIELLKLGFKEELGIDKHFLQEARAQEKKVIGLETEEFQLGMLAGFPDNLQDEMLRLNLLEVKELGTLVEEMVKEWKTGDVAGLERLVNKDVNKHPELMPVQEKLLYERNVDMAAKIDKLASTGDTYFVAVGSGHMVGDRGLVELLKKKGYTVEQIKTGMTLPVPERKTVKPPVDTPVDGTPGEKTADSERTPAETGSTTSGTTQKKDPDWIKP